MIPRVLSLFPAPFVLLCSAATANAQTDTTRFDRLWGAEYDGPRRLELSAAAGYTLSTDWSDLVALHVTDAQGGIHRQVLLRSVAVAPGAGGAAAVTYWRGRHGFRVTAGYSRSCLTTAPRCVDGGAAQPADDAALTVAEVPMDVWRYGVEGIVGLRSWADSRLWRPYLLIGLGGVAYDPNAEFLPIFPGTFETVVPSEGAAGTVVITNGNDTFLLATDELGFENVLGLTFGIGMDLRVPVGIGGFSLRLELADQMTRSPFSVRVARLADDRRRYFGGGRDEVVFRSEVIHNLRATAGLALEFGLRGPREEHDPSLRRRSAPDRLSVRARERLGSGTTVLYLSAASSWEMSIKQALGRLDVGGDPEHVIPEMMLRSHEVALDITHQHTLRAGALPPHPP